MEIVTTARRDVRQIVMEARRELLVLSAQVQAALGDAGARPDPAALLNRAGDTDGGTSESSDFSDSVFAPEEAVKGMLEEARADMDALVEDARTVPFQALRDAPALMSPPEPPVLEEPFIAASPTPSSSLLFAAPSPVSPDGVASMLLSSPFPSDAVPVPSNRRVRTFVTLFGVAGIAVLAGTIWWLRPLRQHSPMQRRDRRRHRRQPPSHLRRRRLPYRPRRRPHRLPLRRRPPPMPLPLLRRICRSSSRPADLRGFERLSTESPTRAARWPRARHSGLPRNGACRCGWAMRVQSLSP